MMPRSRMITLLGSLAMLMAPPLHAQQLADARVGLASRAAASSGVTTRAPAFAAQSTQGPRRWPYVVGGAVIGAVAGGVWLGHQVAKTDDAMVFPVYAVGVLGIGAGLGALGGLIVSAIVLPYPN